ncbi:MAG: DUF5596 domain-containing protein [Clostridia bacterium]|nr:DUF5596 domain-containing protein [Clostridia bacterium]
MQKRIDYLKNFIKEFDYPADAQETLTKTCAAIYESEEAAEILENILRVYESDLWFDYNFWYKKLPAVAEKSQQQQETVDLVFLILMSEHLRQLYIKRNIDLAIYHDSCLDFKAKLFECYDVRGIWGTFVTDWFGRFFNLTRFALGRLQFEISVCQADLYSPYRTLLTGENFVGIHIPALGPLKEEDVRASFINASKFFAPAFKDGIVPFRTGSWLIAPEHTEMLNSDSNIRKFMNFFHITPHEKTVEGDFWRIFNTTDCNDVEKLPDDNSLRRAYIKAIKENNIPHLGLGLFWMQGEKFL